MYKDIKSILISYINSKSLDSTSGHIALNLYRNLNNTEDVSLPDLAKTYNVSNAAVTRFTKNIGLDGFYELRDLINKYHNVDKKKFYNQNKDLLDMSYIEYIDAQISELEQFKQNINSEQIHEIASLLYQYDDIFLLGSLQSISAAFQLQATLFQFDITSQIISNPHEQRMFFEQADKKALIIIFSISGDFLNRLFNRAPNLDHDFSKIVLITQNEEIMSPANYDIIYKTGTSGDYSINHTPFSLTSSLISLACYQMQNN